MAITSSTPWESDGYHTDEENVREEFLLDLVANNHGEDESLGVDAQDHVSDLISLDKIQSVFGRSSSKSKEVYFYQDHIVYTTDADLLGGFRGAAWRALNQVNSFNCDSMMSTRDAKLMFMLMDHALNNEG